MTYGPRQANLVHMRAAKVQASLRIRAVSPEPPLLAHTSSESRGTFRQKARSLVPLNGWACAVKICHDGMLEDTNSLDAAHIFCQKPSDGILRKIFTVYRVFELGHSKIYKMNCCMTKPTKWCMPSLIRVFVVHFMGNFGSKLFSGEQRKFWSDWADAQADLNLHWVHRLFCWFCGVAAQIKCIILRTSSSIHAVWSVFAVCTLDSIWKFSVRRHYRI